MRDVESFIRKNKIIDEKEEQSKEGWGLLSTLRFMA
jgi:hypothetical protein